MPPVDLPRDAEGRVRFVPPAGLTKWPPVLQWDEVAWSTWLTQHGWSPEKIANYIDNDRFRYGIGLTPSGEKAGPHNAYETGVKWLYLPVPKAVLLHETKHTGIPNILFGGAVGGTKSTAARAEATSECLFSGKENYRALVIRRELEELRRTHLDAIASEATKICEALGDDKAVKVTAQPPVATFLRTGAKIVFGFAASPGDELRYLSENYDLFIGDEASLLQWKQIIAIAGRLRNDPKLNTVARMILATNPGGPSHQDLLNHFILKNVSAEENPGYLASDYTFIKSVLYDNPFLMSDLGDYWEYEKRLLAHEPERRRQLLEGDWSAIVNAFFPNFNPEVHVQAFK
jgi:hypothetical protein